MSINIHPTVAGALRAAGLGKPMPLQRRMLSCLVPRGPCDSPEDRSRPAIPDIIVDAPLGSGRRVAMTAWAAHCLLTQDRKAGAARIAIIVCQTPASARRSHDVATRMRIPTVQVHAHLVGERPPNIPAGQKAIIVTTHAGVAEVQKKDGCVALLFEDIFARGSASHHTREHPSALSTIECVSKEAPHACLALMASRPPKPQDHQLRHCLHRANHRYVVTPSEAVDEEDQLDEREYAEVLHFMENNGKVQKGKPASPSVSILSDESRVNCGSDSESSTSHRAPQGNNRVPDEVRVDGLRPSEYTGWIESNQPATSSQFAAAQNAFGAARGSLAPNGGVKIVSMICHSMQDRLSLVRQLLKQPSYRRVIVMTHNKEVSSVRAELSADFSVTRGMSAQDRHTVARRFCEVEKGVLVTMDAFVGVDMMDVDCVVMMYPPQKSMPPREWEIFIAGINTTGWPQRPTTVVVIAGLDEFGILNYFMLRCSVQHTTVLNVSPDHPQFADIVSDPEAAGYAVAAAHRA